MGKLPKLLKGFGNLIDGFDNESIVSWFGAPKIGKSLQMYQVALDIATQLGKNVGVIDTEGGAQKFVDYWGEIFKKRIGGSAKTHVLLKRNLLDVLRFHGYDCELKISEVTVKKDGTAKGGKMEVILKSMLTEDAPVASFIKKNDIGVMIYDSVTEPLRIFQNRQENYPARADATGFWTDGMFNVMDNLGCVVFAAHHQSMNPANPYAQPAMRGGNVIHHMSKCVFYLDGWDRSSMRNFRKLYLVRYYDAPAWVKQIFFRINDAGFSDATEEETMKAYKG